MRRFFDMLQVVFYRLGFIRLARFCGEFGTPPRIVPQQVKWIDLKDADPNDVVLPTGPLDVN